MSLLPIIFCLAVSYLAIAAHQSSSAALAIHLPALAVVIVAKRLPPALATVWAFGIGLSLDALGRGPLGVQAAALVAAVWLLSPMLRDDERRLTFRVIGAAMLIVLATGLASAPQQLTDLRAQGPEFGLQLATTMGVTAIVAGVMTALGRRIFGTPCTIR